MGLVFKSHEDELKMTGVPVEFIVSQNGALASLVVNFLTVSSSNRQVIATGFETSIPLSEEWQNAVASAQLGPNDQLAFALERVVPQTPEEKILSEALIGRDQSLYAIKDVRVEPNPMAAYR